jgi:hypothetical protein
VGLYNDVVTVWLIGHPVFAVILHATDKRKTNEEQGNVARGYTLSIKQHFPLNPLLYQASADPTQSN